MTAKLCPKCGKEWKRLLWYGHWYWAHQPVVDCRHNETCDYSEPESTPRCPKRKERAK